MKRIGDVQFRIMCDMWGVDDATKVAKRMGLAPTQEQIEAAMRKETEAQERWNNIFKDKKEDQR